MAVAIYARRRAVVSLRFGLISGVVSRIGRGGHGVALKQKNESPDILP